MIRSVLNQYEKEVLAEWLENQLGASTLRSDLLREAQLRDESLADRLHRMLWLPFTNVINLKPSVTDQPGGSDAEVGAHAPWPDRLYGRL